MITNVKAIKTGKYTEFWIYKNPIEYGHKNVSQHSRTDSPKASPEQLAQISSKRATDKLRRLIIGNLYHYTEYKPVFLTLTTQENITDLSIANNEFKLFIKRFNYKLGYNLKYIAVPEFQERGAVHFHIIIFNIPFIQVNVIREIWRNGEQRNIDIRLINRGKKAFKYITKYISKTFIDIRFKNKKRYFWSLDVKPQRTLNSNNVAKLYSMLNSSDIINQYEFSIKNIKHEEINTAKKIEFLSITGNNKSHWDTDTKKKVTDSEGSEPIVPL